jgi:hypothetical protein
MQKAKRRRLASLISSHGVFEHNQTQELYNLPFIFLLHSHQHSPSRLITQIHHNSEVIAMGIDAGFDMVPSLTEDSFDKQMWKSFTDFIKELYENNEVVEVKSNIIIFHVGEKPCLPSEGHKLLRFSSKISGPHVRGVEKYLDEVTRVASDYFGSRVQLWSDVSEEQPPFYDWKEVNKSYESYESVCFVLPTTCLRSDSYD